jgi:hypothetical protein
VWLSISIWWRSACLRMLDHRFTGRWPAQAEISWTTGSDVLYCRYFKLTSLKNTMERLERYLLALRADFSRWMPRWVWLNLSGCLTIHRTSNIEGPSGRVQCDFNPEVSGRAYRRIGT